MMTGSWCHRRRGLHLLRNGAKAPFLTHSVAPPLPIKLQLYGVPNCRLPPWRQNVYNFCIAFVRTFAYNKSANLSKKGVHTMAKSANLYARIEPDLKEQAEGILSALGIPASNAITMFYKQIVLQKGLPFEVKLPASRPVDVSTISSEQLNEELEKGYADIVSGNTRSAKSVFDDIRKDYGV